MQSGTPEYGAPGETEPGPPHTMDEIESTSTDAMTTPDENRWTRKDAWLGLLFLGVGGWGGYLAIWFLEHDGGLALIGPSAFVAVVFTLLGANAVVRAFFARR